MSDIKSEVVGGESGKHAFEIVDRVSRFTGHGAIKRQKLDQSTSLKRHGSTTLKSFEEIFKDQMMTKPEVMSMFQYNPEKADGGLDQEEELSQQNPLD